MISISKPNDTSKKTNTLTLSPHDQHTAYRRCCVHRLYPFGTCNDSRKRQSQRSMDNSTSSRSGHAPGERIL